MSTTTPRSLDIVAGQVATKATANITNNITINETPVKISPQSSKGSLTREIRNSSSLSDMQPDQIGLRPGPEVLENKARFIEPNPYEVARDTLAAQYPSSVRTRDISQFEAKPSYDFQEELKHYGINLLTTNNLLELLPNLIDKSKRLIMAQSDLIHFIALYGGFLESDITINFEPIEEVGCLCKKKPFRFRTITNIKILQRDFKLFYNDFYNKMMDVEKISLETIVETWI